MPLPFARLAPVAAVLGGASWTFKGLLTIFSGTEPPLAFSAGLVLFPLALLAAAAGRPEGRASRVAVASSGVGVALSAFLVAAHALGPAEWAPTVDRFTPIGGSILGVTLGVLVALVALGFAARRPPALEPAWGAWAVAVAMLVAAAGGGLLEALHPRLFELPVAVAGVAWVAFGASLARRGPARVRP